MLRHINRLIECALMNVPDADQFFLHVLFLYTRQSLGISDSYIIAKIST